MESIVSVIVPVYNVQRYLETCLDSLLCQTWPHLEIILVDDGSNDGSERICDEYAQRDSRVKVIHQVNAGAANAKNVGLDAARGDYIAFMDSDDWAEGNWIETMLTAAKSSNADVVECSFRLDYVGSSEAGNPQGIFQETLFETQDYLRHYPTQWSCALFWNKLFRAELVKNVRFHTERRCVDDEFFTYKAVTGANNVLRIVHELYHYRQRRSSVTQSKKTLYQRTIDDIDILAERHQWVKAHYPDIALDYLRHDVDTLLYFAGNYPFNPQAVERYRATAKYYFRECLRRFPGKVTVYYAVKALLYKEGSFHTEQLPVPAEADMEKYYP